eukprot:TRINITY_DN417_c0_g1_i1.p1 TRINITY_DN417_c0_g1~~TRINITY_DN417_c0_g1_i1.p1  ORF type:complete len:386 (-),score=66.79 TRINITY_DN417_c0_g1_i1:106-1173(-)
MTCLNRVELTSLIAEGGHSAVYFGRNLDTFEPLAVKEVVMDANGRSVFRVELDLLKALPPHRNIPKLLGYRKTREKSYLILPYLPFPNLKTFLSQRGPLSEEDAIFVLAQMIDTVNFMMNHGVSHRDIKPDNIMVNPDNLQIKFIDFGLGKRISSVWDRTTEFIGTPLYMSPELLSRGSPFNITVSDLWSVGVVFLELLLGSNPFLMAESEQHLLRMQRELDYSQFSEKSSDLLHALLDHSTTKRMYALDLVRYYHTLNSSLSHFWFWFILTLQQWHHLSREYVHIITEWFKLSLSSPSPLSPTHENDGRVYLNYCGDSSCQARCGTSPGFPRASWFRSCPSLDFFVTPVHAPLA